MGWASGSALLGEVIEAVIDYVPADKQKDVIRKLIKSFEDRDCDTLSELEGYWPAYDAVLLEIYGE